MSNYDDLNNYCSGLWTDNPHVHMETRAFSHVWEVSWPVTISRHILIWCTCMSSRQKCINFCHWLSSPLLLQMFWFHYTAQYNQVIISKLECQYFLFHNFWIKILIDSSLGFDIGMGWPSRNYSTFPDVQVDTLISLPITVAKKTIEVLFYCFLLFLKN